MLHAPDKSEGKKNLDVSHCRIYEMNICSELVDKDLRILNPIISLKFLKICIFRQKFEVWNFHQSSNLTSVEIFW